ncbi:hypothetical protein [Spirosoma foliorum]|uniref:Uncharacterized protein n=1 Tax=Spirosoma foliorum TaxID=2710596 RepID=A0A7G5GS69_9BACT|nr:hypothetical protein [Spirosoma foliorum]QMW01711.1 hypothetical protein H3H32_27740 [Spirosoma foliorum]
MNSNQTIIDEYYNGDVKRFDDAYAEAITEGRKEMVQWNDLITAVTILPDLEDEGRELIEERLGYLPSDNVILPYEPYLRGLLQGYRQRQMTSCEFRHQVDEHVKLIRNADMMPNLYLIYDPEIYQNYDRTFSPYGYAVRSRLVWLLGYQPNLDHSLIAEMWLRDVFARDTIQLPETITAVDWKAITLIKYREVLLEHGQMAADASPLLQLHFIR